VFHNPFIFNPIYTNSKNILQCGIIGKTLLILNKIQGIFAALKIIQLIPS